MSGIDLYNRERWPMLQIHNTISRKKEEFKPINEGQIGMYVCGVTVYDLCHIGHARTFVNFDMVVRYLRYRGYKVRYIRNIKQGVRGYGGGQRIRPLVAERQY